MGSSMYKITQEGEGGGPLKGNSVFLGCSVKEELKKGPVKKHNN